MSSGTLFVRAIPVQCSRALWPMLGWKPEHDRGSTLPLNISVITTPLVYEELPVRFLLISPSRGSTWTAAMRSAVYSVDKFGRFLLYASRLGLGGR